MGEIAIRPEHGFQFSEGIKFLIECYFENEGTDKFDIWVEKFLVLFVLVKGRIK